MINSTVDGFINNHYIYILRLHVETISRSFHARRVWFMKPSYLMIYPILHKIYIYIIYYIYIYKYTIYIYIYIGMYNFNYNNYIYIYMYIYIIIYLLSSKLTSVFIQAYCNTTHTQLTVVLVSLDQHTKYHFISKLKWTYYLHSNTIIITS